MPVPAEATAVATTSGSNRRAGVSPATTTKKVNFKEVVIHYEGYFLNQRDKEEKRSFVDGVCRKRQRKRGFAQLSISSKCLGIQPLSLHKYS